MTMPGELSELVAGLEKAAARDYNHSANWGEDGTDITGLLEDAAEALTRMAGVERRLRAAWEKADRALGKYYHNHGPMDPGYHDCEYLDACGYCDLVDDARALFLLEGTV